MERWNRDVETLAAVARLCLGAAPAAGRDLDWRRLRAAASAERCAALAWWRSGDRIRAEAPGDIVESWRAEALATMNRGDRQLAVARWSVDLMDGHGIEAAVARGPVLSHRLYGHHGLRLSADVDLFVDAGRHRQARDVLVNSGAVAVEDAPPFQTSYRLGAPFEGLSIEVHSWLLDDTLLTGLRVPIGRAELFAISGTELPVLSWRTMPAFLAADMASEHRRTLLQDLDFHALWFALSPTEREGATVQAEACGLAAYLRWATARAAVLEAVVGGDDSALSSFAIEEPEHQLTALLRFADSAQVTASIIREWLLPEQARGSARALAGVWRDRLIKAVRLANRPIGAEPGDGTVVTDRDETLVLVRAAIDHGNACWLRARGISMEPAIPSGALVRLEPVLDALREGDVVLAALPTGGLVIHRVKHIAGDTVVLRGDNLRRDDSPTTRSGVIARVAAVERGPRSMRLEREKDMLRRSVQLLRRPFARVGGPS